MDYTVLKPTMQNGIALVTISRPEALNALNSRFFEELNHYLGTLSNRDNVKVLILTGEGKAFVAGADIAEMVDMDGPQGEAFSKKGQQAFEAIESLEIPVIAAVNGFALGGGCELAMACDFRIASTLAKFGQPEVNLGLIPGYAGTQRLPRLVGLANALWLLYTADMITAAEALRIGLVQKVVEPEALLDECLAIAARIASKGPKAVKKVKHVTRLGMLGSFGDGCHLESEHFGSLFGNEGEEGMRAFLEKRKPSWQQ
jgi:enoyl-CoA hydratase